MSSEPSGRGLSRWIIPVVVVAIFFGARQLYPGGLWGLAHDVFTEASASPKTEQLRERLVRSLLPIGASALCAKSFGKTAEMSAAVVAFNARNESAMKALVAEIEALGGLSKSEKELVDRTAYREAKKFVDGDKGAHENCQALSARINAGEFDL